jgi:hypothetical protein
MERTMKMAERVRLIGGMDLSGAIEWGFISFLLPTDESDKTGKK